MAYVGKITDTSGVTGLIGSTLYGTCSTDASTAAKAVTLADFDQLIVGVTVHVFFTNSNTADNPTLNVNSTGAKAIIRRAASDTAAGTAAGKTTTESWAKGSVVSFTYRTYTPSGGSATGVWMMNDKPDVKTLSIGSATAGTAISASKISSPASGTVMSGITTWTANTPTSVTLGTALKASKVTLGTDLKASKVTLGTAFSVPNVTGNTEVACLASATATISSGVLTFSTTQVSSKPTRTTLGTAFSIPNVTGNTEVTIPNVTGNTEVTIPNVTNVTAGTAATLSYTDYTLTYTNPSIPNISVASKTVLTPV